MLRNLIVVYLFFIYYGYKIGLLALVIQYTGVVEQ